MREVVEDSRPVFSGRVIEVRVDRLRLEDGALVQRELVVHSGSVAIVAFDDAERVLLVRQYRHGAGQELWEIPAGRVESGEAPEDAARRELREETGFESADLLPLLDFFVSPGYSTEHMWLFVARGLRGNAGLDLDRDERIEHGWYAWDEALAMCLDGRIRDGKTVAALLAAARRASP